MTTFSVVQPSELSSQFVWNATTKKFSVVGVGPSADAGNILTAGTDGASLLTAANVRSAQITYTFTLDPTTRELRLTDSLGNIQPITGAVYDAIFDDVGVSADNTTLTFSDRTAGDGTRTLVLDVSKLLTAVAKANTASINLSGDGTVATPISASLNIDPLSGNLLKVTMNGAKVDPQDILALLTSNASYAVTKPTDNTIKLDNGNGINSTVTIITENTFGLADGDLLTSSVNGVTSSVPVVTLTNTAGDTLGFMIGLIP